MVGEKYETYNHPHIVLYALNQSLIDDFEKLAAIYAYEEQKNYIQASKPQCDFLSLARSALIRINCNYPNTSTIVRFSDINATLNGSDILACGRPKQRSS